MNVDLYRCWNSQPNVTILVVPAGVSVGTLPAAAQAIAGQVAFLRSVTLDPAVKLVAVDSVLAIAGIQADGYYFAYINIGAVQP